MSPLKKFMLSLHDLVTIVFKALAIGKKNSSFLAHPIKSVASAIQNISET